jgi:hypothetical protein
MQMRIAHLIVVHKNPLQLLRLLQRLKHPSFDIYVHVDKKISIDDFTFLKNNIEFSFVEHRTTCNWGGNSVLMSIINSVEEILTSGKSYGYINVISGQDYPLMSSQGILDYFQKNEGMNFISFDESSKSEWWTSARSRYEKYHLTDLNVRGKYMLQSILNRLTPERKFPYFKKLYGGNNSTWWTVTGDCAKHVVETITGNKKLSRSLHYSWGTDEFIVSTIIMNSSFREKVINNNLRYIDWSERKASPKTLNITDFHLLERSTMMFARKFDIELDDAILNLIDQKLLTKQ